MGLGSALRSVQLYVALCSRFAVDESGYIGDAAAESRHAEAARIKESEDSIFKGSG